MTIKQWAGSLILGLGAVLAAGAAAPAANPPVEEIVRWEARKIESFLKKARIVEIRKDREPGRTLPWRVILTDGKTKASALFKYVNRKRPTAFSDSFHYELAAYQLSRHLGLDFVPPSVERQVGGTPGALQWYLEGSISERDRERAKLQPPDLDAFLKRLDDIKIFELLVGDECQDKDDILIHKDGWKVCRVDFSESFPTDPTISGDCPITRCSRRLFDILQTTTRSAIADRLRRFLSDAELDALWARQRRILAQLRALIQEKGERDVIY